MQQHQQAEERRLLKASDKDEAWAALQYLRALVKLSNLPTELINSNK